MLTCCVCKIVINDPETLFTHLKDEHKIKGNNCQVQCTMRNCWAKFSNFSSFKKHVLRCVNKVPSYEEEEMPEDVVVPEMYAYSVAEDMLFFEKTLNRAALELVCYLCATMNAPRNQIYTTITAFKKRFITRIISGIKEIISPRVLPEEEETVNHFIKALESSFDEVETEFKLETALTALKLFEPSTKCEFFETVKEKLKNTRKQPRKEVVASGEVLDVDGAIVRKRRNESEDSEDSERTEETNKKNSHIRGKLTIMPIEFQMKKFFELPGVFDKVKLNTRKLQQGTDLDHFIKGKLWKRKMENYRPDQFVIPFHFYGDGLQTNNPLGPHAKLGEQQFNYYSFPTIPYEYQSRLDNIFLAQSYIAKYHQVFSTEKLYNNIIETFRTLAEDGIILDINGEKIAVFFVLGIFIGDNKEQNQRLSFVGSHSGSHPCRYCRMGIDEIRRSVNSEGAIRRNRENYEEDVVTNNVTATGIHEFSPFNRIPFFHVVESSSPDLSHDLNEGFLHPSLSRSILHFISKKYFDLNYLNDQMSSIDFGEAEKGNVPVRITNEHLKVDKLKMNASEMTFFIQHFTIMVGDRVPHNDPVWLHVLTTIKYFDLCNRPSYNDEELNELSAVSEKFNVGLKNLFGLTFQHKVHLGTHYKELTEEYGPLRYVRTIRFEAKHREMKNYTKNINSRVHLAYSVGKKSQYNFALRLLLREGLEDRISIPSYTADSIENKVYYPRLELSIQLDEIFQSEGFFAKKAIINGIIFSTELWLPNFINNQNHINEIVDVVMFGFNDVSKIFVICKTYSVTYVEHYGCHRVDMQSIQDELSVININEFLSQHYYPVKIHRIQNEYLFKCKRF